MRVYGIDILGIAEHRTAGQGHFHLNGGGVIVFSGRDRPGQSGVGFYSVKVASASNIEKCLLRYNPVGDRIMTVSFRFFYIQVYAPNSAADEKDTEAFYGLLAKILKDVKSRDMVVIMGDFNAKVEFRQHLGEKDQVCSLATFSVL